MSLNLYVLKMFNSNNRRLAIEPVGYESAVYAKKWKRDRLLILIIAESGVIIMLVSATLQEYPAGICIPALQRDCSTADNILCVRFFYI